MNIIPYLDRYWKKGEYDCWSLVREVYRQEAGIDLPVIVVDVDNLRDVLRAFTDEHNLSCWHPVPEPEHLCLAFFSPGRHHTTHCGIWLDIADGRFLHLPRNSFTVCEDRQGLERGGWVNPSFYRYSASSGVS
ncbi:hypothetical protein CI610_00314 [invertebrate metagenome]|uniref:NlpC/P60 domain-containing protein n=1 Tax=invertebrate metagenome TaxID=1711999 RepID=A0A2H9TBS7_9ZZZZ